MNYHQVLLASASIRSRINLDNIPKCLSNTNQTFEDIINPIFQKTANPFNLEDLRQIALLEYKLKLIDLNIITLDSTYLRSGTGKLNEDEHQQIQAAVAAGITTTTTTTSVRRHNSFVWPPELKKTMLDDSKEDFKSNTITHDQYLSYVMKKLREFREQNTYYLTQLKERKQRLSSCFTLELEEVIKNYVEEYGIRPLSFIKSNAILLLLNMITRIDYMNQIFIMKHHIKNK